MSKKRTRLLGLIAIICTVVGAFGMTLSYRGALSPCLVPILAGAEGFENGFPIGKAIDGRTITMDLQAAAGKGPLFIFCGSIWLTGAVVLRLLMGWGDLLLQSRREKLLGLAGGIFQFLGSFMFLYSAWGIVALVNQSEMPAEQVSLTFGPILRSTLSGLATFTIGNIMTAIFLKFALDGQDSGLSSKKRKITSCLSFVPMAIIAVALINAFFQLLNPADINATVLAAFMVGIALPMAVGSIPLMVNTKSIPRE